MVWNGATARVIDQLVGLTADELVDQLVPLVLNEAGDLAVPDELGGSIKEEKLEDEAEDEDDDEMSALGMIDWVSQWLVGTRLDPYIDEQAEETQSAFTFYDSDVSVGGEEFEAGSYALTQSSEGPPAKIRKIEDWELRNATEANIDSDTTALWSGE